MLTLNYTLLFLGMRALKEREKKNAMCVSSDWWAMSPPRIHVPGPRACQVLLPSLSQLECRSLLAFM